MSYPLNYPTPQNANVQIFNAGETKGTQSWIKPQGASFVWFTLIGAGGGGGATDGTTGNGAGGGSGAVTNCMIPAFLIPDELQIQVGKSGAGGLSTGAFNGLTGTSTLVNYIAKGTYNLLTAVGGNGGVGNGSGGDGAGGTASTSNYFSAAGFFQSIAGQTGLDGAQTASATTFLSSGSGGGNNTANYGYSAGQSPSGGFFQMQPIIVGVGGTSNTGAAGKGGIGCGGGGANSSSGSSFAGGDGGDGLVVIISW